MNSLKQLLLVPFLFVAFATIAQNSDDVLIKFKNENIDRAEFKRVYLKNNSGEMVSKSTIDEYLDLYLNFKLKVKEAESLGMDTNAAFVNELAGYRKQLAQPYLTADGIYDELKKEAYARLQEDLKGSHILVSVSEEASPEDTLAAYKRAINIKKQLEKGANFEDLAKQYSDDPSAKTNGGNLGYFTAFYMVYPFETAAYNTKKGDISKVVRTQFGYHILKIFDRRPSVGSVKVAHILISNDPEFSKTEDPEGKINEIYKKIKNGEAFEEMAKQFSDDTRSSDSGGELATFGVSRMEPKFEEVAFKLKKDGDISKPFETPYGWHIVKRIAHYPIGDYKSVEEEMMIKIKKDSRSNLSDDAVLKKIMKQYGFKEVQKEKEDFYELIDSTYFSGNWKASKAIKLTNNLFEIGDKKVNQKDFANYLQSQSRKEKAIDFSVLVNKRYNSFKRAQLLAYKDSKLDGEYPEFANLMNEYHDGILLFNLTDELVWSKAVKDTIGLEKFYEANKESYKWDKRADAVVFSTADQKIADEVKKLVLAGKDLKEITEEVNKTSQLNLKYEQKKYLKGENETIDKVEWKKGFSNFMTDNGRVKFVQIKEIIEPTFKTLDDSKGVITSDYQNYLEKEWIKSLRAKYSYEVDNKVLNNLKKELE